MTLYFDTKVQFLDSDAISTIGVWHQNESIFAVASFSQNRGGSVTIFDDLVSFSIKKSIKFNKNFTKPDRVNHCETFHSQFIHHLKQLHWFGIQKNDF